MPGRHRSGHPRHGHAQHRSRHRHRREQSASSSHRSGSRSHCRRGRSVSRTPRRTRGPGHAVLESRPHSEQAAVASSPAEVYSVESEASAPANPSDPAATLADIEVPEPADAGDGDSHSTAELARVAFSLAESIEDMEQQYAAAVAATAAAFNEVTARYQEAAEAQRTCAAAMAHANTIQVSVRALCERLGQPREDMPHYAAALHSRVQRQTSSMPTVQQQSQRTPLPRPPTHRCHSPGPRPPSGVPVTRGSVAKVLPSCAGGGDAPSDSTLRPSPAPAHQLQHQQQNVLWRGPRRIIRVI